MLSSALSQVLERARTRYGLEVEILDGELRALYPEAGTDFSRSIRTNTELRQALREVLVVGHPRDVEDGGERYRVYPLRQADRTSPPGGLLAVKGSTNGTAAADAMPWSEFARAAIEADLSASDTLREQRQQSRRLLAILRFLRYLVDSNNEADLTQAIVQAAAVWYDVDARVYRRDLSGDFVLHNWLPAVEPDDVSRRLDVQVVAIGRDVKRLSPTHELGAMASLGGETLVVPLGGPTRMDYVMTLSGAVPAEADSVFQVVGPVVGVHLENIQARRVESQRCRYETIVGRPEVPAERIPVQVVGELMQAAGASAASLTLISNGGSSRRMVSFGPPAEDGAMPAVGSSALSADRFVCGLALGGEHRAVLELRPAPGASFTVEAADATTTCAHVLQTWLSAALSSFSDPTDLSQSAVSVPGFEKRIEEELERAKRFDLHLSLVLVDVSTPSALVQIQEALRRELRGSDLLGTTSGRHVAALLTHTDDRGLDNVIGRLRRRLADAADRLNISDVRLGQAALSADCRTADALLSRAVSEAENIVVH